VLIFNSLFNPLVIPRFDTDQRYFAPVRQMADVLAGVQRLYGPENSAIGYRNHALQNRVETTYGYNPLELAAYADYIDAAAQSPRLIDALAATHTLKPDGTIAANPTALPLAYFAQSDASATVDVVQRSEDSVVVRYRSSSSNLLRIAIPSYPGWHAQRDGLDLQTVAADGAFIGVIVPAGEGDIRLKYTPRLFWWGAVISGLALLGSVIGLTVHRR
jgi:hypothetical protein